MRLFVAVPVPEEIREKAGRLADELRMDGITPVRPENMHLTLKFLGEVPEQKVVDIETKLRSVDFSRFDCTAGSVGVFPNENYIKVVWAGIESGGALEALAKKVISSLHGYGGDERLTAHLTIARVKRKIDLRPFLQKYHDAEFGFFSVSVFELIQSVLKPGGPEYSTIATFAAAD